MGWCLVIQIVTGFLLVMHYCPDVDKAFASVVHIMRDVNNGWFIRNCHATGASMFFVCAYIHIARGIFYESFYLAHTWLSGVNMFLLLMAIAFTGYVLP